jgi:ketosteroid isomerase-like protein
MGRSPQLENRMSASENKWIMERIYAELANGNGRPFVEAMAEDFSWTVMGHSAWSRTWSGKDAVRKELLAPLFARFAGRYTSTAQRMIADGEYVVVECRGNTTTKEGLPYENQYCLVFRLQEGKMKELIEYMDTDYALKTLGEPAHA